MPAPEVAPPGYRDAAFPPDQPEFALASPVRIAQEMFRIAAGAYDELHDDPTLLHPARPLGLGFGSCRQDRNSQEPIQHNSTCQRPTSKTCTSRLEGPHTLIR